MSRLLWIVERDALERGVVPAVLRAGVRRLHLRDPSVSIEAWRKHLATWCALGPRFEVVVNAGPAWALEAGCGAHLKAAQAPLAAVDRRRWARVGRSIHDLEEARRALDDRPDYLVAGPVFPTTSKPGHPGIGSAGLRDLVEAAGDVPVVAIGGITPARVATVAEVGAAGVSVRSGITTAPDPADAARAYLAALGGVFLPANAS